VAGVGARIVVVVELADIGAQQRRVARVELAAQLVPAVAGVIGRAPLRTQAEVATQVDLQRWRAAIQLDLRVESQVQVKRAGEPEDRALRQRLGGVGDAVVLEQIAQRAACAVGGHPVAKAVQVVLRGDADHDVCYA